MNTTIPIIDLHNGESDEVVARVLVDAAKTHGFVYIRNTGQDIPITDIDHAFHISRNLFASPMEEKMTCAITADNKGWSGMHTETLDVKTQRVGDFKECFNFSEFRNGKAQQPLPPALTTHEQDLAYFFRSCHGLCLRILNLFAIGLQIPPHAGGASYFSTRHSPEQDSGCTLRLLFYPAVPADADYDPKVDIRAGAHSDYGSITLLFQRPGQAGLEVLTASESWAPVPVFPPGLDDPSPPILINIGDLLSYWTNGLLRSTVHRVIFPKEARRGGEDRYSIAFFCHPNDATLLEAVPSKIVEQAAREGGEGATGEKGTRKTAREHLMERLKATYLNVDFDRHEDIAATKG